MGVDMSVGTEPARWPQPHTGSEDATLAWLDALAGGICSPEAFLEAMRQQSQGKQDEGWEVLSLLDQYYRRGKIKAEVFHTLKTHLEGAALDSDKETAANVRPHSSTAVTAPAGESRPSPAAEARTSPAAAAAKAAPRRCGARSDRRRQAAQPLQSTGRGGPRQESGTVFRQRRMRYRVDLPTAGRRLAVKVLHTAVTQREELLAELQREFQHLQLLSHPNIVRVHEFDRDGEIAFFTMELLGGALLSRVLQARNGSPLPQPYALCVIRDIGAALSHAHSRGVIHGDVNPQNIFVTNEGELRVLDFGASHKLLPDPWSTERSPVATPGYASCQLLEGQHPDARDDLFAFACVIYLLLSGEHPFPKRTAIEARAQRLRLRRPTGLTGPQWRVLREGLRWEREGRPADVQKWLNRFGLGGAATRLPTLPMLLNVPAPKKSRPMVAVAAIFGIALLAAGGYWVATNYDSLAHNFEEWRKPARPPANADALPEAPPPLAAPAALTAPPAPPSQPSVSNPGAATKSHAAPSAAPPARCNSAAPAASGSDSGNLRFGSAKYHADRPSSGGSCRHGRTNTRGNGLRHGQVIETGDLQRARRPCAAAGNIHGEASLPVVDRVGHRQTRHRFRAGRCRGPRALTISGGSVILDVPVSANPGTH